MKVKLKIKHLIMIPIIIFVIVPNFLYFVGKSMFSVRWQFESGVTTREYSYGVFNLYTKWPKVLSPFDGDAYFYMGRVKYDYNMKYVSNGGDAIIGRVIPLGTYEEALALYKKGLQMSNGIDYSLNTIALFNLHMEKGNLEEAKKLIDESLDKKSYKENSAGKVLEVQLAIMENDKNKGRELYKKYYRESRNTVIEKLLEMDNDDYYVEDNRNIGDEIKFYNEKSFLDELSANINIPRVYKLREYNEDGSDKLLKGNVTVKGKLTLEGKPLKYVPIIVGNVGFSEYTDDFSYGQIEGKVIYTDKDGNYEIKGLPELEIINVSPILSMDTGEKYVTEEKYIKKTKNNKVYELNLDYKKRMNINIDEDLKLEGNKFDINFDKVNGAEYYETTLAFIDKNAGIHEFIESKDNKVSVPLINGSLGSFKTYIERTYSHDLRTDEEILKGKKPKMGVIKGAEISFGGRFEKDTIDYVEVKAIKVVEGRKIIINSNRVKTSIEGKDMKTNEGIKLLDNGKMKEGEEWFLNKIKEEGYKPEYIYPLVRLRTNHYPWEFNDNLKEYYTEERFLKAKESEEILLKELYKINENKDEINYLKNEYESFYERYGNRE